MTQYSPLILKGALVFGIVAVSGVAMARKNSDVPLLPVAAISSPVTFVSEPSRSASASLFLQATPTIAPSQTTPQPSPQTTIALVVAEPEPSPTPLTPSPEVSPVAQSTAGQIEVLPNDPPEKIYLNGVSGLMLIDAPCAATTEIQLGDKAKGKDECKLVEYQGTANIFRQGTDELVTTVASDSKGQFKLDLKPGDYYASWVHNVRYGPDYVSMTTLAPTLFRVEAFMHTNLTFQFDSGVR